MQTSIIYEKTMELIPKSRRIIHQGGASAGKTVNILGALATIAAQQSKVITITSMSFPHLKAGAMRDFDRYVLPSFSNSIKQYRKTDHTLLWKSGSIIEFKVFETEYDARGPRRNILYINEANTFDYMTYFQADSRSELSIIDYNPTIRFWAHEKVKNEQGTSFVRSWHQHNPFLTDQKHKEIESIKDPELWRVYARGLTGNVQGVIYPDWILVDEINWEKPFFAIDFGYTVDETALVKMERKGKDLFVQEMAYKPGLSAEKIKNILYSYGYNDNTVLYCERDPDMIKQLRLLGIRTVAARKGPDTVNAGIAKLKEYNVHFIGNHIKDETETYIWVMDDLGNPTNKPSDEKNHLLDAIRYGAYTHFYRA